MNACLSTLAVLSVALLLFILIDGIRYYARLGESTITKKDPTVWADAERDRRIQFLHDLQIENTARIRERNEQS